MRAKALLFNGEAIREGLDCIARRPWLLFALMFLANALGAPYCGLIHDAKL